jgi:hypothetical protein
MWTTRKRRELPTYPQPCDNYDGHSLDCPRLRYDRALSLKKGDVETQIII